MPVIDLSAYKPVPATLGDANQIANGFQAIQNVVNALDNNNFAAGKIFDPTKLMQNGATDQQGLLWDAASSTWKPTTLTKTYRKTTSKTVVNTVTETDLLNGEITLAANDLGTNKVLRLRASGDWKQNSGAGSTPPQFKLKLGATTLFDTGTDPMAVGNSATRGGWEIEASISSLGATNSQWATINGRVTLPGGGTNRAQPLVTGEGFWNGLVTDAPGAMLLGGVNSAALDDTGTLALVLSVILPVANAAVDIVLKQALVVIE